MQEDIFLYEQEIKNQFIEDFKEALYNMKKTKEFDKIFFICAGTDKITGDSLGPFVGSKLEEYFSEKNYSNIYIYGTLDNNINHENIKNILNKIDKKTGVIIVDAALSNKQNMGNIYVLNKKTVLGKGLKKNNFKIGDISIKTVVARDYKNLIGNFNALKRAPITKIIKLSNILSEGIYETVQTYL